MRIALPRRSLAAAACLACAVASAAELGTLFNTPEERDRLDRLRRGEPAVAPATAQAPRGGEVTGFVKRSDGRGGTVFIDGVGHPVPASKAQELQPGRVNAYADRKDERLKVERRGAP